MSEAGYAYHEDVNWGLLRLWGRRSGLDVLDLGCGFATTSQRIQALGNRVVGVEQSPSAVPVARQRIERVVESDLQATDEVKARLQGKRFDALIFADVLEHLAWPLPILRGYLDTLKPTGSVFVSLPNVGLWSVRAGLLFGRFEYQDTGVLDRTHLRFFTVRSARRMLEEAGLRPLGRTFNPGLLRPFVPLAKRALARPHGGKEQVDPGALLRSRPYRLYLKLFYPFERLVARTVPGLLAFQMVFEARLAPRAEDVP